MISLLFQARGICSAVISLCFLNFSYISLYISCHRFLFVLLIPEYFTLGTRYTNSIPLAFNFNFSSNYFIHITISIVTSCLVCSFMLFRTLNLANKRLLWNGTFTSGYVLAVAMIFWYRQLMIPESIWLLTDF